jgi:hypothetical protein
MLAFQLVETRWSNLLKLFQGLLQHETTLKQAVVTKDGQSRVINEISDLSSVIWVCRD